jgi:hypothetical protein
MFFSGQEGARRRVQNLVDFHDDPAASLLFSTDAGTVGLNLQRAANACVLLELPWNPAVLEQRVGRIHRMGQKDKVDVYAIVARDAIEERIAGLVADKRALFRGLFDGGGDDIHFDRSGSFLEQIRCAVSPGHPPETNGAGVLTAAEAEEDADVDAEEDADAYTDVDAEEDADAYADVGADAHTHLDTEEDAEVDAGVVADENVGAHTDPHADAGAETDTRAHGVDADGDARIGTRGGPGAEAASDPRSVAVLLAGLTVERVSDGGMRIIAPPESADVLASLFETLAHALRNPRKDE